MKTRFHFGQFFNLFGTFFNRAFPKQESTNQNPTFALVPDLERLVKRGPRVCNGNNGEFFGTKQRSGHDRPEMPPADEASAYAGLRHTWSQLRPGFFPPFPGGRFPRDLSSGMVRSPLQLLGNAREINKEKKNKYSCGLVIRVWKDKHRCGRKRSGLAHTVLLSHY